MNTKLIELYKELIRLKDFRISHYRSGNLRGHNEAIEKIEKLESEISALESQEGEEKPSDREVRKFFSEVQIKEIVSLVWKDVANAFRMYPDSKHTFSAYWDISKDQFNEYRKSEPEDELREEFVNEVEIVNSGTNEFPFYQIILNGVEFCSTDNHDKAGRIKYLLQSKVK
jgi:hypothetical protein